MFGLGPEAIAAILGAIAGGMIGIISGVIIEELSWKHRKEENRIKFIRDLSQKRMDAYHAILYQLMVIEDALITIEEVPEKYPFIFLKPIFSQAFTVIFPYLFLLPERLEKKINNTLLETLSKIMQANDKSVFLEISNELLPRIKSLIDEMRKDLKNLEKI